MNKYNTVEEWLAWMKSGRVTEIDLSLERVTEVGSRLNLLRPPCPVITVGGTNGKGSCVAGLEAIYLQAGYRVGAFTTPYLFRYNEQVRIQGKSVTDKQFCDVFERISHACGNEIQLTVFEYGTLAAFMLFKEAHLDVWILEVGLGGRWDAVNVIDADVAIVSSIGLDHTEWLGNTREAIAVQKAGIFRQGHPAICGDFDPPKTLVEEALKIKAPFFCQGKSFGFKQDQISWTWWGPVTLFEHLPKPVLLLQNMATVLMAIDLLQEKLAVEKKHIDQAMQDVRLPGRLQQVPGEVSQLFDVSHNPAAVALLAEYLQKTPISGKTHAVFSMLADKDISTTSQVIKQWIDEWHIAEVKSDRAAPLEKLIACFKENKIEETHYYTSVKEAYENAMAKATPGDRLLVFGSFRTVVEVQA